VGAVIGFGYRKIAWGVVALLVIGPAVWLSFNVRAFGHHFAYLQPELEIDYAMGILMWVVFAVGIFTVGGDHRRMLLLGWIGKFFVVLVAMLFYEQLYDTDSIAYFNFRLTSYHASADLRDTDPITSVLLIFTGDSGHESIGSSANFMRLFALITSVMPPYFHALKVGLAFLGFLGSWYFYRAVVVAMGREYPPAFYLLAFFPSIVFWSSTLGKDPVVFFFMGLYAYGGALWLVQGRLTAFLLVGAGLLGTFIIRPWISIMGAAALFGASVIGRCRPWQIAIMLLVGASGLYLFEEKANRIFGEVVVSEFIQQRAEGIAQETAKSGGSGVELPDLMGDASFAVLPWVMFTGLFRPLPFDITNPFTALAAVENTVILWLALVAIYRFRMVYFRDPLVLWPVLFSLMWTTLYGLIVMANFGTGLRYKLQTIPFLLLAIALLTHREGRALLASRIPGRKKAIECPSECPSGQVQ